MVRDLIAYLNRGFVVYANFKINWSGYDERSSIFCLILGVLCLKRRYKVYPASNCRFMPTDETWYKKFSEISNAIVAVDEAYVLFDSYQMAKLPMNVRMEILQTRKKDRSLFYTTQRPTAVHVVLRGMTNIFYRCKKSVVFFVPLFSRREYDLGADETVDEEKKPISWRLYLGSRKYFNSYNTKELIGSRPLPVVSGSILYKSDVYELHRLTLTERVAALAATASRLCLRSLDVLLCRLDPSHT